MTTPRPIEERFWQKVDVDGPIPEYAPSLGPCWIWTGALGGGGYGRIEVGKRPVSGTSILAYAHRWLWEYVFGAMPKGLVSDHLCRVRECVNPLHIEPVTVSENARRSPVVADICRALGRAQTDKPKPSHCPEGHPYDETNTYWHAARNTRRCRICHSEYKKQWEKKLLDDLEPIDERRWIS